MERGTKYTLRSWISVEFQYLWMLLAEFSQILQINTPVISYGEITVLFIATLSVNLKKTEHWSIHTFFISISYKPKNLLSA